jgi:SH3-like domain-containing protein
MSRLLSAILLVTACLFGSAVGAIEYRSVAVPVAISYDTYSTQGKKLYLLKEGAPLEVVTKVEGWVKVRDAEGMIAWVMQGDLSARRMVVVTAPLAEVRQSAVEQAPLVFQAEKWVALELLEGAPPGWAKVKHRDGASGFVRITQVWGL